MPPWCILLLVFGLVLHYTGQGPKGADFTYEPCGNPALPGLRALDPPDAHDSRSCLLALTGYIFFYNNVTLMRLFFATPQGAIVFHWVVGLIFVAASVVSVMLWARDARFAGYDREWLRKRGALSRCSSCS